MSEEATDDADDTRRTATGSGGRFRQLLGPADTEIRDRLAGAVTVVGERSDDLRSQLEALSRQTADAARPVLESVEDHLEENDIDVTIADNEIHVEGDESGLSKIEADLKQGTDVHLEYDRADGITVEIDEGETDASGESS